MTSRGADAGPATSHRLVVGPVLDNELDIVRDLHAESWRDAYAPFVPAAAMRGLDETMRSRWSVMPPGVICARARGGIAGFVRHARRDGWPYIDNLHVRPALRGGGVGSVLFCAAAAALLASGETRMWLTVIAANRSARAFYRAHGGWEGGAMVESVLGHPTATYPVIWGCLGAVRSAKAAPEVPNALDGPGGCP